MNVALFVDYENLAASRGNVGFALRDLNEFAGSYGRVTVRKLYLTRPDDGCVNEARRSGYQVVAVPPKRHKISGVDAAIIVDMMDQCLQPHIDVCLLASGDADFEAVVTRLREKGKSVIVVARDGSASPILKAAADKYVDLRTLDRYAPTNSLTLKSRAAESWVVPVL